MQVCAVEMDMYISQEQFCMKILKQKNRNPGSGLSLFASLRSRNEHGHLTRVILRDNLQGKNQGPRSGRTLCASVRSRNGHVQLTKRNAGILKQKNGAQNLGAHCV